MNLRKTILKTLREQCFSYPSSPSGFGNYGCMDSTATNYDPFATHPCNSIGPSLACSDCNGNSDYCGPGTAPGDCCDYPVGVNGCTDPIANNYDPTATVDDGSCTYNTTHLFTECSSILGSSGINAGMTWSGLVGYDVTQPSNNSQLFYNFLGSPNIGQVVKFNSSGSEGGLTFCLSYDGSTTQNVPVTPFGSQLTVVSTHDDCNDCVNVYGCTNPSAINYDPTATIDDGSCIIKVPGCTDQLALNYDPAATVDDGSCVYEEEPEDCSNQLDIGCWVCKDPINFPGCQEITSMNQVTLATSYGLPGFNNQQDCVDNTPCGSGQVSETPCEGLESYVTSNYTNWSDINQGGAIINLDSIHFCEKCNDGSVSDVMCKCCKKDPCDKKYLINLVNDQYGLPISEFCKYCNYNTIQDQSCKCCKRFEKIKIETKLKEEVNRMKSLWGHN